MTTIIRLELLPSLPLSSITVLHVDDLHAHTALLWAVTLYDPSVIS